MMSRTGGGHVAAAEALTEALAARYGSRCQVTQLDVFTEYMRYPFNRQPQIYAQWVRRAAWLYGAYFAFWNLPLLHRLGVHLLYQPNRSCLRTLFTERPADVYVSVHAAISGPVLLAAPRGPGRPAFLAVGVDLISAHRTWFDEGLDACVMPTEHALACGRRLWHGAEEIALPWPAHPPLFRRRADGSGHRPGAARLAAGGRRRPAHERRRRFRPGLSDRLRAG